MASSLSEPQRLKIEENRQRALALRAARQQQKQPSVAANCNMTNVQISGGRPASNSASYKAVSQASYRQPSAGVSGRFSAKKLDSSRCQKTMTAPSCWGSSSASFRTKQSRPPTLADSSNFTAVANADRSFGQGAPVPVKCCLVSRQKFAADVRYFAPLVEVFKTIPSRQYGEKTEP